MFAITAHGAPSEIRLHSSLTRNDIVLSSKSSPQSLVTSMRKLSNQNSTLSNGHTERSSRPRLDGGERRLNRQNSIFGEVRSDVARIQSARQKELSIVLSIHRFAVGFFFVLRTHLRESAGSFRLVGNISFELLIRILSLRLTQIVLIA